MLSGAGLLALLLAGRLALGRALLRDWQSDLDLNDLLLRLLDGVVTAGAATLLLALVAALGCWLLLGDARLLALLLTGRLALAYRWSRSTVCGRARGLARVLASCLAGVRVGGRGALLVAGLLTGWLTLADSWSWGAVGRAAR